MNEGLIRVRGQCRSHGPTANDRIHRLYHLALLLHVGGSAVAQGTTGSITGAIVDSQGLAVPGVTVTVTGPQGAKTAVTEASGRFNVPFLVPGTYTVRSELQGFKPVERQNVTVGLGQTVELNLKMEVGGLTETVQVSSASPVIDTSSTTIGANIDSELLSRLPVGRRFSDTLYVAPGVSTGGTVGEANPSISGGSGLENQYVVDGVNITNQGYGALGSYSIVFGSLGNGTPFDFMKEVQVKSGGYEAEYGQATGGVVNVVTKSGTNSLRGTAFGYVRPTGLESDFTHVTTPNGTVNTAGTELSDAGIEAGGPILRNKLFFFGAVDPQWEKRTFIAPADFPLASLGEVDRKRQVTSYAVKGTWQATQNHRFDASFFGDPAHGDHGPTADHGAVADDDVGVQRAREVRRPQPVRALRRHHRVTLARRGVVRARPQRDRGDPVGGRVEHDRHDRHAQYHLRRHRLLRAGQPQRELPVPGQGDEPGRQSRR